MREQGSTTKVLASVIGRSEGYLRKRMTADTYLLDLPADEVEKLARFFGVDVGELVG